MKIWGRGTTRPAGQVFLKHFILKHEAYINPIGMPYIQFKISLRDGVHLNVNWSYAFPDPIDASSSKRYELG